MYTILISGMYIAHFSSRVYGASYLLYFGALYMDVHLREMLPIAKLATHPLHKRCHSGMRWTML